MTLVLGPVLRSRVAAWLVVLGFSACAAFSAGCSSDSPDQAPAAGAAGAPIQTGGAGATVAGAANGGVAGSSGSSGSTAGSSAAGSAGSFGGSAGASLGGSSAGGAGGLSGSAGSAGSAGTASVPSLGCGMAAGQALNSWVEQAKLPVNGKDRQWWVWLPNNYDPQRAYPVVFTFHGCGGPTGFLPMQNVTGANAIVVRGSGGDNGGCWQYSSTSDDVKFFDAMLADVESKHCADSSRVFLTGYSSGAWFSNTLDCARGDKIRATGTVSGGVVNRGTCTKGEYARIFVHDADDTTNYFSGPKTNGNEAELAKLVGQNHCQATTPVPEDPAPCARYQGCDAGYPVIMCQTHGKMHDRQDQLATSAFWKLFSSL